MAVKFLTSLNDSKDSDIVLRLRMLQHAHLFTQTAIVNLIKEDKPDKLRTLLDGLTPIEGTSPEQHAGILLAMIALGDITILNMLRYLNEISDDPRDQTLINLRAPLKLIVNDWGIIGWLLKYWQYIMANQIHLITYMDRKPCLFSMEKLQASRVC
jgi:hypothetical protein